MRIGYLSNNSEIVHDQESNRYQLIGDPTEGALMVLARKSGLHKQIALIKKVDDMPFDAVHKMRATLIAQENDKQIFVVGAPEKILLKSTSFLKKDGSIGKIDAAKLEEIKNQIEDWSKAALRVIALAYKKVENNQDTIAPDKDLAELTFAGIVGMIDPPRPDAKQAVLQCKKAGIRVIMATGDHIHTAIAIARATGIVDQDSNKEVNAYTEAQLENLDETEFSDVVKTTNVFARLTPQMKLRIATTIQSHGELIAMTGDGVNDAPALKKADVGIAMGIMGTDVARDSAKVILADDNFATIVNAIEEGRIVFINARQTSFFLLTTNFAEIATLITAVIIGMPMPLTATQILWLNLVTDGVGDKALAFERNHGNILEHKPAKKDEPILSKEVIPFLIINAIIMTVLTIGAFKFFDDEGINKARSSAFLIMAFCQLFNIYNMRSLRKSIFEIGFFSNKYVNLAILVSLGIQIMIVEVPFFQRLFNFELITAVEFITLAALASIVLVAGEIYKLIHSKLNK